MMPDLETRLGEVPEDAVQKPYTDPHGAAVTALLVADWLDSVFTAAAGGNEVQLAGELSALARAMVGVVDGLGGEYLPDGKGIPGDLVHRGQAVRAQAIAELEKSLKDADAKAWLDAVRLGAGVVDLVYDLRTIGVLHARRAETLSGDAAKVPASVRAAADAIEYALRAGESAEDAQARARIARIWTLLAPAYERAADVGRAVTRGSGAERMFPALPLVASHRRARRRPLSVVPTIGSVPPPPPSSSSAVPTPAPGVPAAPAEPITILKSEPPPPGSAASMPLGRAAQTWTESRCAIRHLLEIEVALEHEDRRYVGFTENMSTGGAFVATFLAAKAGATVRISLTMRDGETVSLAGEVRWQRPSTNESWPGVGVKFDDSGAEHDARMHRLLSLRDRML